MLHSTVLAVASIALIYLIAERGLACNTALRQITPNPRDLARFLIGFELLACALAGITWQINSDLPRALPIVAAIASAWLAGFLLLRRQHAKHIRAATPWLIILTALSVIPAAMTAGSVQAWLVMGLATALLLALGLPAFVVLAQRLEDSDVPAVMRRFPGRLLLTGILALGLAGSVTW